MAKKSIPADRIDIETKLLRARAIFDLIGSTNKHVELNTNTLAAVADIGSEYIDSAIRFVVSNEGELLRIKREIELRKTNPETVQS